MSEHVIKGGPDATTEPDTGHNYDEIREFDNPLPRWWLLTLYGTVVFSMIYWFYYHTLAAGPSSMASFQEEMQGAKKLADEKEAQLIGQMTDEQLFALAKDTGTLQSGAEVYKVQCLACHGDKGQGVIGPNLTDSYWLHGSKPKEIYQTISNGVVEKNMPAWKAMLGTKKVRDVLAFVLSIRDTNASGKPPEGKTADGKQAP